MHKCDDVLRLRGINNVLGVLVCDSVDSMCVYLFLSYLAFKMELKEVFGSVEEHTSKATRKDSSEIYIVARKYIP